MKRGEYKTTDEFWASFHDYWTDETREWLKKLTSLKKNIDHLRISEETKKALKGRVNEIGKWVVEQEAVFSEIHLRELKYEAAIKNMNQERDIFKEIVTDLSREVRSNHSKKD